MPPASTQSLIARIASSQSRTARAVLVAALLATSALVAAVLTAVVSTTGPGVPVPVSNSAHASAQLSAGTRRESVGNSVDPAVQELVNAVEGERALNDLRQLAGDVPLCTSSECRKLTNRLTGSSDLELATDYIAEELTDSGYDVDIQPWRRGLYSDRNVLARKTGVVSPTEEVYFVAHVDGVASCPARRCPAADDNASGTVGGLEVARIFADTQFARTLVLMFSTGEEQNTQGVSRYLEQLPPDELKRIRYLVNVDMIGWDGNGDSVIELYYGDHSPSRALAEKMKEAVLTYEPRLVPHIDSRCG